MSPLKREGQKEPKLRQVASDWWKAGRRHRSEGSYGSGGDSKNKLSDRHDAC